MPRSCPGKGGGEGGAQLELTDAQRASFCLSIYILIMAEILTADGLFVSDNSACLTRQVQTGDISNEEEEALLSEKTEIL